ncbi:hypothetical protein DPMN_073719 [Dreissena polymorpha]|uniref:Uncharacterized protein n=1 Tax=Dreissena polymorpha TaxID=45954 RepID=A0A9D4BZI7_DREPO|nr:hypothetical protein DPMN_073719 [Dreissena polymorpha]
MSSYRNLPCNNQRKPTSCGVLSVNCQSDVCGYGVAPGNSWGTEARRTARFAPKRWEDGSRRLFKRGSKGWRPSSSRRWERSQRWKLGWRPPEFLTSKICTA